VANSHTGQFLRHYYAQTNTSISATPLVAVTLPKLELTSNGNHSAPPKSKPARATRKRKPELVS
jgi:hypothetical protein